MWKYYFQSHKRGREISITIWKSRKHSFTRFQLHGWDVVEVAAGFMVLFGWAENGHSFQKTLNGWRGRAPEPIRPEFLFLQPPQGDQKWTSWPGGRARSYVIRWDALTQLSPPGWLSEESGSLPSPWEPPRSEPQGSTAMTCSRMRGHCCPSLPCFTLPPPVFPESISPTNYPCANPCVRVWFLGNST